MGLKEWQFIDLVHHLDNIGGSRRDVNARVQRVEEWLTSTPPKGETIPDVQKTTESLKTGKDIFNFLYLRQKQMSEKLFLSEGLSSLSLGDRKQNDNVKNLTQNLNSLVITGGLVELFTANGTSVFVKKENAEEAMRGQHLTLRPLS